jgi:wyosine [tRNA(Phe)-imidazoG37] synthetase (radical SAM superfamily)
MNPHLPGPNNADGGHRHQITFGCPHHSFGNRFLYVMISPRVHGLAIGINISPDAQCNFQCVYCEAHPPVTTEPPPLDLEQLSDELQRTVDLVRSRKIREYPGFENLDDSLLEVRQIVFSGEGEPTISPGFSGAVQCVMQARASNLSEFFRIVLLTNGLCLDQPPVRETMKLFTLEDEIWIKLDAGTQAYMEKVNGSGASLNRVMNNILHLGRQRPINIQSLFPLIDGVEPPESEIDAYIQRLTELRQKGVQIPLVQVYSAGPTGRKTNCGHLPLKSLFHICHRIKTEAGFYAEVF